MTDAAQVEEALKHFPCGPGGHSPNAGMLRGRGELGAYIAPVNITYRRSRRPRIIATDILESPAGQTGAGD